jgi:hypothetical protein
LRLRRSGKFFGFKIWSFKFAPRCNLGNISPHDHRRTCARLCHVAGGELEQIQFLLGHVSVQTTEPYLGCKATIPSSLVLIRKSYSVGPFPGRFASANGLAIAERISIGRGNTIVVFFSVPISTSVCKYRSWIAMG